MAYNPDIHHRRSIRLKGYNYSAPGIYFITICTYKMKHLFGKKLNGKMIYNESGVIAESCWREIPEHFPFVNIDEFVIMPNHVHGIIVIGAGDEIGANNFRLKWIPAGMCGHDREMPVRPRGTSKTIGSIVRGYKIGVTKWFRQYSDIYPVWQRDYYEHIIRNELELSRIRGYIKANPAKWR